MNKILFTILLLVTSVQSILCQSNWIDETATWKYEGGQSYYSFIELKVEGKDSILNKEVYVLEKVRTIEDNYSGELSTEVLDTEYIYAEDSVVYLYTNQTFDTLFAMNKQVGESWVLPCYDSILCENDGSVFVLNKGVATINGVDLNYIVVKYTYDSVGNSLITKLDTIVETIGPLNTYFLPWDYYNGTLDRNEGGKLRCYSDDRIGLFKNKYEGDCDQLVKTEEANLSRMIVYPSLIKDFLCIESPTPTPFDISIFSSDGSLVYKSIQNIGDVTIQLKEINKGVYIIHLFDGTHNYQKIIKP